MRRLMLLAMLLALGCGGQSAPKDQAEAPPPDLQVVNRARPGEAMDLKTCLSKDRVTLVEFFSDECPPCREMEPILEFLAEQNRDLAIRRVDIDRAGHSGIDFDSPLAEQYGVDAVPAFRIYSADGRLTKQGPEARDQVRQWYSDAQMVQHAERPEMQGISERYRQQE